MKELMPLENVNAVTVFSDGGLDNLLESIHKEANSLIPDLETDKGRKAIASMAAKVAKSKTYLDGLGKDLVSGWKTQAKAVDNERKKMRDNLDELKANIRKPLTDYENTEKERTENIENCINEIMEAGNYTVENWMEIPLDAMKDRLIEINNEIESFDFAEYKERAGEVHLVAKTKIEKAIEKRETHETEQVELEKLRLEATEREKKDHEKRIADEAAKAAKQKAENAAKADKDRIEKEKQDAVEAKELAEKNAKEAAEKEREKIEFEKLQEKEAAEKREANTRHRKKINNQAVDCLITSGIDKETAIIVITAIAKKEIDNVTISY